MARFVGVIVVGGSSHSYFWGHVLACGEDQVEMMALTKNLQFVASVIAFAQAQNPLPLLAVSFTTVR
jgi:hypothetical protein